MFRRVYQSFGDELFQAGRRAGGHDSRDHLPVIGHRHGPTTADLGQVPTQSVPQSADPYLHRNLLMPQVPDQM